MQQPPGIGRAGVVALGGLDNRAVTHSHWHAAFSLRRASPAPRCSGARDNASSAPSGAIRRAKEPISASSARVTGTEVITGGQSEWSSRAAPGPGAKWVCRRSRPAARDSATASRR